MSVRRRGTELILGGTRKRTHVVGLQRILRGRLVLGYPRDNRLGVVSHAHQVRSS